MTKFDAIIFDFDGVILESGDIKVKAFSDLYEPHGPDVVAAALSHHQAYGGISRRKKIRHIHREFLDHHLNSEELEDLCQTFSGLVEDAVVACPWVPGAHAFLERHAGKVPMFVVSGTPHDELTRIVTRRGIKHYFTAVFGSPPEKPPIIRDILTAHGLAAGRVLFVGDALTDCHAAGETGLRFIGRVPHAQANPFPVGTEIIPDLTHLSIDLA